MRRAVWWLVAAIGVTALLRQQREAARTRAGSLRPLGPGGSTDPDEGPAGHIHATLGAWQPARPRTPLGRAAATAWSAPLTLLGLLAGALGGTRPRWDATHGAFVLTAVRGPARWFLRMQSAAAATLGQVVVLRETTAAEALLAHEVQHARQQERLGPLFAIAYPVASAVWGYRRNPFEVAARATAAAAVSGPPGPA